MTKAIAQTYTTAFQYRSQIATALVGMSLFLSLLYAVNVYRVIAHTVALQRIQVQETSLSGAVAGLDSTYLGLSSRITPDALQSYGFTQGQISQFISRAPSLGSVAMSGHEL